MEKISSVLGVLEDLQRKYDVETDNLGELKDKIEDFHLCVPLIGEFSSGKSTFINTLLDHDKEICVVDTRPTTAVPMEICYGEEEHIWVYYEDGHVDEWSYSEYEKKRNDLVYCTKDDNAEISQLAKTAKLIKLQLNLEVLRIFPSIALADLPGLGSEYKEHDKAVYDYIANSMAYIVVISGEKLAVERELGAALSSLATYKLPTCVMVTRAKRIRNREEAERNIKDTLTPYFGDTEIKVFFTDREEDNGEREIFIEYLKTLEKQSKELGAKHFASRLKPEAVRITNYLQGLLKNMNMSMSALEGKKEQLQAEILEMNEKIDKELKLLVEEKDKMIQNLAGDVQIGLEKELDSLAYQCSKNGDVTGSIKNIVQKSLNESWHKNVTDRIKKHIQKISDAMNVSSANYAASININADAISGIEINGVARVALDFLAYVIGGPLGVILSVLLRGLLKGNKEAKIEQAREQAKRELLSNVFPKIDQEIREKLNMELDKVLENAKLSIEAEVVAQTEVLTKALDEVILAKGNEDKEQADRQLMIESDINVLESLNYGIE